MPSTVPSTTVAPLAANTMSGSPGTGSMVRTSCPRSRYTWRNKAHCRIAVAASAGSSGRIHGLIAYVTAKCSGGHIRYRRVVARRQAVAAVWIMSPG